MRSPGLAFALVCTAAVRLSAQASLHVSVGARYTSTLVHDSIVTPLTGGADLVDVRPDLSPTITGVVGFPLRNPWRLELLADLSTGQLRRHDLAGAATITRVWTLGLSVGLRRTFKPWLEGRIAVGGLKYLPADRVGLFSAGTGGFIPYGSVAFDAVPEPLARRRLAIEAGADLHRFITPALRTTGFTDARVVYRISAGLRLDLRRARAS